MRGCFLQDQICCSADNRSFWPGVWRRRKDDLEKKKKKKKSRKSKTLRLQNKKKKKKNPAKEKWMDRKFVSPVNL